MDTLYDMLSSERRRRALRVLTDAEEPLDRDEIARRIAVRRGDCARSDAPSPPDVEKIAISLGHVHLPKLEDGGLVDRTEDDRYDVTPLGRDVERAARAFEESLAGDDDGEPVADGARPPVPDRNAVRANDGDGDDC